MKTLTLLAALCLAQPGTARLHDGSVLKLTVTQPSIEVQTKYGTLTIPTRDVRRIEFGSHFRPGVDVQAMLKSLGDANPKAREASAAGLWAARTAAYPHLLGATNHPDMEVKTRAAALVTRFRDTFPVAALKTSPDDVIHAVDGLVRGRITTEGIRATWALGDVTLRLADLAELTIPSRTEWTVTLNVGDDWTEAGHIPHSRVVVTADGQVDLWPQGAGQYVTGPKGYSTAGKGTSFMAGAIVGKLNGGEAFLVGDNFAGDLGEGLLYLRIVPSPWNNASSGSYRVKIRLE